MNKIISTVIIALALVVPGTQVMAETLNVIVSKQAPIKTISESDVKRIYLSKRNTFPGGGQVVPIDQPEDSKAFAQFYENVIKKSQQQLRAYRSQLIFTGKGQPPKQVSDAEMIELIANNPSLIGYVLGNVKSDKVKVLISF